MNIESDQKSQKTLIVVLGMHRSGTSVLTRAMQTLGGEFGERLLPPVEGVNDKGFFEDVDVNATNEELLKAAGSGWHAMTPIDLNCVEAPLLDRLQTRAITVLREKCANNDVFVLKDPRLSRLLPFWQPVFACLNLRVVYVVAVRSPISVVKSLAKVHRFGDEKSYVLWLTHVVAALEDTREQNRVFVDYDRLMDAPEHELARVSDATGLPVQPEALEEFRKEFLESGLRNSRFSADDLDVVRAAPAQVKGVFSAMQRAAAAQIDAYGPELDIAAQEGRRYLESVAPLLRYEWRLVQHMEEMTRVLDAANSRVEALEVALRSTEAYAAESLRASEVHRENLLNASEARAASEIAARDHVILGLQDHVAHLEASQRQLTAEREADKRALEALESKVAAQEAELRQAGADLAQVLASTSWRITAPLRAVRRMGSSRAG